MHLKIYFAGSIGGGRQDAKLYGRLIKKLKQRGEVLTQQVGDMNVLENEKDMTDKEIHDRDISWLKTADVLIAEVTQTSMGVGYEIGRAIGMGIPCLCIFRPDTGKHVSSMIGGCGNGKNVQFKTYTESEFDNVVETFFNGLKLVSS